MLLQIIPEIKKDLNELQSITINFVSLNTRSIKLCVNTVKELLNSNIQYFTVKDSLYENCEKIEYVLSYDSYDKIINKISKNEFLYGSVDFKKSLLKINKKGIYKDVKEDKDIIFYNLNYKLANEKDSKIKGNKNLIYYTVYGEKYCILLNESLKSLHQNNNSKNFDVLIITDYDTKQIFENNCNVKQYFNIKYHLVEKPTDAIQSSMNKTKVFDYAEIDYYNKILFLDCDIICLKDVQIIFDSISVENKLYVFNNPNVDMNSYASVFHGLKHNTDDVIKVATDLHYKPFNAGQFCFVNSERMKNHFSNLNIFINDWPSAYFFEQSFMNVYFVLAGALNFSLRDYFCLANCNSKTFDKVHNDVSVFLHFIAPALDGEKKLEFINSYKNTNNI